MIITGDVKSQKVIRNIHGCICKKINYIQKIKNETTLQLRLLATSCFRYIKYVDEFKILFIELWQHLSVHLR